MNGRGRADRRHETSSLPPAERAVFAYLVRKSDNTTGQIRPEYAWKLALRRIAEATGYDKSTVARAFNHLEAERWISRKRSAGGAGKVTLYTILPDGEPLPCECAKLSRRSVTPLPGAERTRRWRTRKTVALTSHNTRPDPTASHNPRSGANVTASATVQRSRVTSHNTRSASVLDRETQREERVTSRPENDLDRGPAVCAACDGPLDPALPAAGFTTHPCCDPSETVPGLAPVPLAALPGRVLSWRERLAGPAAWGPCARCRAACIRYGPHGSPLCPSCRGAAA